MECYQKALKINPNSKLAQNDLATAQEQAFEEAVALIVEAQQLLAAERFSEASKLFERALLLVSDYEPALALRQRATTGLEQAKHLETEQKQQAARAQLENQRAAKLRTILKRAAVFL